MLIANLKQQPQALLLNWKPNMSWKNFKGAIAQHIPGTTTNRINKINRLSENPESLSSIEQARIAAGHVMGRAAGGAVIGAGVNGYEYSQTGMGFGGSFSMTESVLSGAVAGAIGGGLIGSLGAKAAGKNAVGNVEKSNKQIATLTDKLTNNQRLEYRKFKTEARAAKRRFTRNEARNPGSLDLPNRDIYAENRSLRFNKGSQISAQINSYNDFNSSASLGDKAKKRMRTHIFSKPING